MRGQSGKRSNAGAVSGCAVGQAGSGDIGGGPWPLVRTLFFLQHKYTSIAEVQVHMEDEYLRSPLSGVSVGWGWGSRDGAVGTWFCLAFQQSGGLGLLCSSLGKEERFLQGQSGVCEGTSGRSRGYPTLRVRAPRAETEPLCWWLLPV